MQDRLQKLHEGLSLRLPGQELSFLQLFLCSLPPMMTGPGCQRWILGSNLLGLPLQLLQDRHAAEPTLNYALWQISTSVTSATKARALAKMEWLCVPAVACGAGGLAHTRIACLNRCPVCTWSFISCAQSYIRPMTQP